jgi:GH24 family phage-related lysozyme (muramidase)
LLGEELDELIGRSLSANLSNAALGRDSLFKIQGDAAFRAIPLQYGATGKVAEEAKAFGELAKLSKAFEETPERAQELYDQLKKLEKLKVSAAFDELVVRLDEVAQKAFRVKEGISAIQSATKQSRESPGSLGAARQIENQERSVSGGQQKQAQAVLENTLAVAGQTDLQKQIIAEMKDLTEALQAKGLDGAVSQGQIYAAAERNVFAGQSKTATELLKQFEGFRTSAYFDKTAYRVGFGSDTTTNDEGKVRPVNSGTTVSFADAERDLSRRVAEFQNIIRKQIGPAVFDSFGENAKAALTSVAYNYGQLPLNVAKAAKSGDIFSTSQAIRARQGDNDGENAKRRNQEADLVLSGNAAATSLNEERKSYDDLIRTAKQREEQINAETAAIGKSVYQKTLAVEKSKLLADATKDGAKLSREQQKEIDGLARATATAEQKKAEAQFRFDASSESNEKIEALKRETEALGQSAYATAKAAQAQELLKKAREDGVVTAEELATVERLSEAYGKAAEAKAVAEATDKAGTDTKKKVDDLNAQAAALRLTESAAAASAYALALRQQYEQAGITITPQLTAFINEQAAAIGNATSNFESQQDAYQKAVELNDTLKGSLKGLATDIAKGVNPFDAMLSAAQRLADKLLDLSLDTLIDGIFGSKKSGNAGGIFSGILSGLFGGARASGGPVAPGKAYLVGEKGPELATFGRSGTIIPNHALQQQAIRPSQGSSSGGGTVVKMTQHFHGVAGDNHIKEIAEAATARGVMAGQRQEASRHLIRNLRS